MPLTSEQREKLTSQLSQDFEELKSRIHRRDAMAPDAWNEVAAAFYADLNIPHKAFVQWLDWAIGMDVSLVDPAVLTHLDMNRDGSLSTRGNNVLAYVEKILGLTEFDWRDEDIEQLKEIIVTIVVSLFLDED